MSPYRTPEYLTDLVQELRKLPREVEWVEFKLNNSNAEEIGEYISALSNAAALGGRPIAYLIWGIRDHDHALVGTSFSPYSQKIGNEEIVNWLVRSTRPQVHFQFHNTIVDNFHVVVLEVDAASEAPIRFKDTEWIRVGSYKKKTARPPGPSKETVAYA